MVVAPALPPPASSQVLSKSPWVDFLCGILHVPNLKFLAGSPRFLCLAFFPSLPLPARVLPSSVSSLVPSVSFFSLFPCSVSYCASRARASRRAVRRVCGVCRSRHLPCCVGVRVAVRAVRCASRRAARSAPRRVALHAGCRARRGVPRVVRLRVWCEPPRLLPSTLPSVCITPPRPPPPDRPPSLAFKSPPRPPPPCPIPTSADAAIAVSGAVVAGLRNPGHGRDGAHNPLLRVFVRKRPP